jgi:hypothetical protein
MNEDVIISTTNITHKCFDCEKSFKILYREKSYLCLDSTLGFPVCGSGSTNISHEREKGLSSKDLL